MNFFCDLIFYRTSNILCDYKVSTVLFIYVLPCEKFYPNFCKNSVNMINPFTDK